MLTELIRELSDGKKLILLHTNADPDAVGAGYALSRCFPECVLGAHKSLNRPSKLIVNALSIEVLIDPDPRPFDKVIIVDTSTESMLGELVQHIDAPIIIDHHAKTSWPNAKLYYCDETRSSCCEMVYEILEHADREVDRTTALALLCGILSDSGGFKRATTSTFRVFIELMETAEASMAEILALTWRRPDASAKIAMFKGAHRAKYKVVGENILAYSKIGAFEGELSAALLRLGADVAVVASQKKDAFVLIAKAKSHIPLHLGNLMNELGNELNTCSGGGHKGAAGLNGVGDANELLTRCVARLEGALKEIESD